MTLTVRGGLVTRIAQVVLLADTNVVSTGTLGALVRETTFSADMAPPQTTETATTAFHDLLPGFNLSHVCTTVRGVWLLTVTTGRGRRAAAVH